MKILNNFKENIIVYPIYSVEYIKQLKMRNYFHLIHIDTPTMKRYKNFLKKYKVVLPLQGFLEINE